MAFKLLKYFIVLALTLAMLSCALSPPYDQYVYAQTTGLKVDALKLMDKAEKPYQTQTEAVEKFTDHWDKLYEYEIHRKNNGIRIDMWNLLRDSTRNLLGGYLLKWKNETTLKPAFIGEAKIQVGRAFDQLSELESGKITPKELKQ